MSGEKKASFETKLRRYMDAHIPIVYVDSLEDDRVDETAAKMAEDYGRKYLEWNKVKGCVNHTDGKVKAGALGDTLLKLARGTRMEDERQVPELEGTVLVLKDMASFLSDVPGQPQENITVVSCLKYLAQQINLGAVSDEGIDDCTIIIVASFVTVPKELTSYITVLSMDPLEGEDIKELIAELAPDQEFEDDFLDLLAANLKGLTETQIYNIVNLIQADDGEINKADIPFILEQKQQIVKKSGILEIVKVKERMEDIGGLEILKEWLEQKKKIFRNIERAKRFGVAVPKGVLIVGMPGCGKSLTAKAAAKAFEMPLLRMDMGRLMGKYVGESESNMRRAIALTEASSPCILWIDELEKAFAGIGGGGSEVTTRLFGNFLTWMQEKSSLAFVVATANDITNLPPELLRKGRFDEIFFVDLPNKTEREKIFRIHIGKKHQQELDDGTINLGELVQKTEGYCGADIEGVVHDGIERAFVSSLSQEMGERALTTDDLRKAIANTHSISETMKDSLKKMRDKYQERKFESASRKD